MMILPTKYEPQKRDMLMAVLRMRRLHPELITKEGFPEILKKAKAAVDGNNAYQRSELLRHHAERHDPNPIDRSASLPRGSSTYAFIAVRGD